MERTFTNQQGEKPCFICGEIVANGEESTWDRSPKKQGKCHITCLAARNVAERNGAVNTSVAAVDGNVHANGNGHSNGKSAGGWLDGLAEQLAPYLESRIAQKLDRDEVADMLKTMLDGAVMLKATTVIVENKETATTKDLGLQHELFPKLLKLVNCPGRKPKNIWLTGPAGSGKTTAVEKIADALGIDFYHVGAMDNEYKLMGFIDAQGRVVSTVFREWWEKGGVICLDEVDSWLPAATLALNGALANGHCTFPDGMKPRHANCRVVACANTFGLGGTNDYVGRMKQDAAFLDRFVQMNWPYDEAFELAMVGNAAWVNRVQRLRKNAKAKGLRVIISPRASIEGADMLADGFDQDFTEEVTLRRAMTEEQWESIQ